SGTASFGPAAGRATIAPTAPPEPGAFCPYPGPVRHATAFRGARDMGNVAASRRGDSAMQYGYKLSAEGFGPNELVRQAQQAEASGFDFVEISDHFHPWLDSQGHSPFAWSVLGT